MLDFLPPFLRLVLGSLIMATNTVAHCIPLFGFALVKLLVPIRPVRTLLSRVLIRIAESWVAVNGFTFWLLTRIEWQIEGLAGLRYEGWYLVLSNHQSWVDIPVLQKIFTGASRS